jgi:hypothetical protein
MIFGASLPLSFGEGPGVRSLRLLYPLYVIYFSSLNYRLGEILKTPSNEVMRLMYILTLLATEVVLFRK